MASCGAVERDDVSTEGWTIVTLRKCTRGAPLLPSATSWHGGFLWEVQTIPRPLVEYLRALVARLNMPELAVQGTLHGQHLVPYQAAVPEAEWSSAWRVLEGHFREQKSAYRQLRGGTVAPELIVSAKPKFVAGEWKSRFFVREEGIPKSVHQEPSGTCAELPRAALLEQEERSSRQFLNRGARPYVPRCDELPKTVLCGPKECSPKQFLRYETRATAGGNALAEAALPEPMFVNVEALATDFGLRLQ